MLKFRLLSLITLIIFSGMASLYAQISLERGQAMPTHTLLFPLVNGFTGIVFFSVAAIAWLRAPQSRFLRLWCVYCLLFATYTWSVVAAGGLAPTIEWADTLIRVAMTVGSTSSLILYYFGLTYFGKCPSKFHIAHIFVPWWAILQGLFWLTNLIQAEVSSTSYVSKWAPIAGPAMPFYLAFILLSHLLPVILVTKRYRRERGQDRIQAAYMLIALSIGGIATIGSLLPSLVPGRAVLLWIPALLLPFYPLTITYAIIRYRLLDVRTVIHKTLAYGATLIIFGLVIYFTLRAGAQLLTTLPADEFTVILLGLFLFSYGFFRLVKPHLDHYFQRGPYDPAAATEAFAQRSVGVVDRNAFALLLQKTLDQTLYPEHIVVVFRTQNNDTWMLLANNANESSLTLPQNHFLACLAQNPAALDIKQLRDDPQFHNVRAESEAFMKTLQAQVIVPLLQDDQIIAVIALGERRNLRAYTQTDLEFLDRLAAEASKGLINANLYTEVDKQRRALQDLTITLEERVKSRTLELEHANESLRLLDRHKTNFFANISHEFRTPLTLILGPVEQMRTGEFKGNLQEAYDMMLCNGRRLLRLINQLLDLARLEAGRMSLQARPENISSFLKGLVLSFASAAERKQITLTFNSLEERIIVYIDRDKVEKIVSNLLSNALKFTPEGGQVTVAVAVAGGSQYHASSAGATANFVEISVTDTGPGIPLEYRDKIFDRFYQVDASQTREHEGTGIGLALTKELVELHHGEILVNSAVGRGTSFIVRLPLGKAHLKSEEVVETVTSDQLPVVSEQASGKLQVASEKDADFPAIQQSASPSIQEPTTTDETIILVVEDNRDVRAYIRQYLEPSFKVVEAIDGIDGVQKALNLIPDIIISDIMMPKRDGYELCRILKADERTSHIPIILLTAKASSDSKVQGLETGADDYLIKPFDSRELLARVHNLITLRQQLRESFRRKSVLKPGEIAVTPLDEAFLRRVQSAVEKHLDDEDFGVETLAEEAGMSRAQLHRKLRALIDQSANQLIRSTRLRRAVELLRQNAGNVAEVAYMVGFGSQAYFTKCFHEQFGCSPKEYLKRQASDAP